MVHCGAVIERWYQNVPCDVCSSNVSVTLQINSLPRKWIYNPSYVPCDPIISMLRCCGLKTLCTWAHWVAIGYVQNKSENYETFPHQMNMWCRRSGVHPSGQQHWSGLDINIKVYYFSLFLCTELSEIKLINEVVIIEYSSLWQCALFHASCYRRRKKCKSYESWGLRKASGDSEERLAMEGPTSLTPAQRRGAVDRSVWNSRADHIAVPKSRSATPCQTNE